MLLVKVTCVCYSDYQEKLRIEESPRKEASSQDGQRAGKYNSGCRPLLTDLGGPSMFSMAL